MANRIYRIMQFLGEMCTCMNIVLLSFHETSGQFEKTSAAKFEPAVSCYDGRLASAGTA